MPPIRRRTSSAVIAGRPPFGARGMAGLPIVNLVAASTIGRSARTGSGSRSARRIRSRATSPNSTPWSSNCGHWSTRFWRHCEEKGSRGRTVTLKMKYNDFEIITRSRSVPVAVSSRGDLERLSVALLQNEMPVPKPVRLLGISLSSLQGHEQEGGSLSDDHGCELKLSN